MKHAKKPSAPKASHKPAGGGHKASTAKHAKPAAKHQPGLLRAGSRGHEVRTLQISLEKHGFDPGPIDGIFGPMTQNAVINYQRSHGLGVDGIVGPQTWGSLQSHAPGHGHASKPKPPARPNKPSKPGGGGHKPGKPGGTKEAELRADILRIAGSQIGTTESGENGGAAMKYQRFFGRGPEPWCADFVSWVYTKAGKATNNPYTPTFVQQLKKQGRWKGQKNPQPGDLVFFDWGHDGNPDHVGLVKRVNSDGSITTIEGNTGHPQTGKEGVWQKTRYRMQILGFADVM